MDDIMTGAVQDEEPMRSSPTKRSITPSPLPSVIPLVAETTEIDLEVPAGPAEEDDKGAPIDIATPAVEATLEDEAVQGAIRSAIEVVTQQASALKEEGPVDVAEDVEAKAPEPSFPYTPPDEPEMTEPVVNSNSPPLPALVESPEAGPSTKPKTKRKRGAQTNRRTSTDPAALGRPEHYMGENNQIIRCICEIDEDDGLTIQCETCYAWQHASCFGYEDAESAPDIYFCELCQPRPYDALQARQRQLEARERRILEARYGELAARGFPTAALPGEKPKSRGKPKRPRTGSAAEDGTEREKEKDKDKDKDKDKEGSPGTAMGPPTAKVRRKPGAKPRGVKGAVTVESTPAPSAAPITQVDPDDDFFKIEPWTLEFTPIRDNVVRGAEARRIMTRLYREWMDEDGNSPPPKRRLVSGPSGLPSPTETGASRLSPDNIFPASDMAILAPPVPPVQLQSSGYDIEELASPTSVRVVEEASSFLPLSYSEAVPLSGPYPAPAVYAIFADEPIASGSFIGEYKSEVVDCETYRQDPINQYGSIGLPKPYVRPVGPPVNLILDARGYGSTMRFVRSGCHPNAVLRPVLHRSAETEQAKLRFGVFASAEIQKDAEVVLGWEWDDGHVVHALRGIICPTILASSEPGRPAFPSFSAASASASSSPTTPNPSPAAISSLVDKFDAVLTCLMGTFTTCACSVPGNCALAQMKSFVELETQMSDIHGPGGGIIRNPAGRRGQRADLGPLVGAVRGWRRRELDVARVRAWNDPRWARRAASRSAMSSPVVRVIGLAKSPDGIREEKVDRSGINQRREETEEGQKEEDDEMEVDEEEQDEEDEEEQQDDSADVSAEQMDVEMDAGDPTTPRQSEPELSEEEDVPIDDSPRSLTRKPGKQIQVPASSRHRESSVLTESPSSPVVPKRTIGASRPRANSPRGSASRQSSSPDRRASHRAILASSRPAREIDERLVDEDEDEEDDDLSDATSATVPRSDSSDDDLTSESESETEAKTPESKATAIVRRTPVAQGRSRDVTPVKSEKAASSSVPLPRSGKKSGQGAAATKPRGRPGPSNPLNKRGRPPNSDGRKPGRSRRVINSPTSDEEDGSVTTPNLAALQNDKPRRRRSSSLTSSPSPAPSSSPRSPGFSPELSSAYVKANSPPVFVSPSPSPPPDLPIRPETSVGMEEDRVATPPLPPTGVDADGDVTMVTEEDGDRIATPPLKEATPPPAVKEPTPPPPEPPKKVSLSEYLKNHKIRKESSTTLPPPAPGTVSASIDDKDAIFKSMTDSSATATAAMQSGNPAASGNAGGFNMVDFLPSSRPTPSATPGVTPGLALNTNVSATPGPNGTMYTPTLTATPGGPLSSSANFAPRSEYFPPQPSNPAMTPSSSFQPRVSSSYIPRNSIESDSVTPPINQAPPPQAQSSNYAPRSVSGASAPTPAWGTSALPEDARSHEPEQGYGAPRDQCSASGSVPPPSSFSPARSTVGLPHESESTYPGANTSSSAYASSLPPVLSHREAPPHRHALPPSAPRASLSPIDKTTPLPRIPPTGPKVPPSGPRGSGAWNDPAPPSNASGNVPPPASSSTSLGSDAARSGPGPGPGSGLGRNNVPIPVPLGGTRGGYRGGGHGGYNPGYRGRGFPPRRGHW